MGTDRVPGAQSKKGKPQYLCGFVMGTRRTETGIYQGNNFWEDRKAIGMENGYESNTTMVKADAEDVRLIDQFINENGFSSRKDFIHFVAENLGNLAMISSADGVLYHDREEKEQEVDYEKLALVFSRENERFLSGISEKFFQSLQEISSQLEKISGSSLRRQEDFFSKTGDAILSTMEKQKECIKKAIVFSAVNQEALLQSHFELLQKIKNSLEYQRILKEVEDYAEHPEKRKLKARVDPFNIQSNADCGAATHLFMPSTYIEKFLNHYQTGQIKNDISEVLGMEQKMEEDNRKDIIRKRREDWQREELLLDCPIKQEASEAKTLNDQEEKIDELSGKDCEKREGNLVSSGED